MTHDRKHNRSDGLLVILWSAVLLFAARVAAQALQKWSPQPFLPPFSAFQGSTLSYGVLLAVQLALLVWMIYLSFGVQTHQTGQRPGLGRALLWFSALYFAFMLVRLGVGMSGLSDALWFRASIPTLFHFVLASFCAALGWYHIRQPECASRYVLEH